MERRASDWPGLSPATSESCRTRSNGEQAVKTEWTSREWMPRENGMALTRRGCRDSSSRKKDVHPT